MSETEKWFTKWLAKKGSEKAKFMAFTTPGQGVKDEAALSVIAASEFGRVDDVVVLEVIGIGDQRIKRVLCPLDASQARELASVLVEQCDAVEVSA